MFEREIDGYALRCDIVMRDDGSYHIVICSKPQGTDEAEVRWEIPIHPPIRTRESAERHARYIMAGIENMHAAKGPKYTVV